MKPYMKWAEVIIARPAGRNSKILEATLDDLMSELAIRCEHQAIRVFRREKPDCDICIILFHNRKKIKVGASLMARNLVAAFKEISLVNHTIWNEIEPA